MEEDQEALRKHNCNIEETKIILEEWKTIVQTQMHFNEMIMRARTTGVSVVMGVYGAAAGKVLGCRSHGKRPGGFDLC